jgi:hypothetical protein
LLQHQAAQKEDEALNYFARQTMRFAHPVNELLWALALHAYAA